MYYNLKVQCFNWK